jgi:hypothetical protein
MDEYDVFMDEITRKETIKIMEDYVTVPEQQGTTDTYIRIYVHTYILFVQTKNIICIHTVRTSYVHIYIYTYTLHAYIHTYSTFTLCIHTYKYTYIYTIYTYRHTYRQAYDFVAGRQFILLTPNNLSHVTVSNSVRVKKMPEPERNASARGPQQRTLDFS